MNIASVNSSQVFKGLDYTHVSTIDREKFIKSNYKKLNKMGEQYDISITSCYSSVPELSAIDIEVRPLRQGLNFIQRLLRPTGRSSFETDLTEFTAGQKPAAEEFITCVEEAIVDLGKKLRLHK